MMRHALAAASLFLLACDDQVAFTSTTSGSTSASAGGNGGAAGSGGSAGSGGCMPTMTCDDQPQGACNSVDDGCGTILDCSTSCGDPAFIQCVGGTCVCEKWYNANASCEMAFGPDVTAVNCGFADANKIPPGCQDLGVGNNIYCCPCVDDVLDCNSTPQGSCADVDTGCTLLDCSASCGTNQMFVTCDVQTKLCECTLIANPYQLCITQFGATHPAYYDCIGIYPNKVPLGCQVENSGADTYCCP